MKGGSYMSSVRPVLEVLVMSNSEKTDSKQYARKSINVFAGFEAQHWRERTNHEYALHTHVARQDKTTWQNSTRDNHWCHYIMPTQQRGRQAAAWGRRLTRLCLVVANAGRL